MVLIKEFRIPLPLTVEEYQVAQLYTVAEMSKSETKGDSGIEILVNEPYDDPELGKGQYTHKIYHLGSKVPRFIAAIAPTSALKVEEKAWNSYPYCRTVFTNGFLRDRFSLTVESWHKDEDANIHNVHELDEAALAKREIIYLDIANDEVDPKDYTVETDPKLYHSEKTGRGPLVGPWIKDAKPKMCCYKLVTIKFKVFGFETKVEQTIAKTQIGIFLKFHRTLFCLMDRWFGWTMSDIRKLEDEAKQDLDKLIAQSNLSATDTTTSSIGATALSSVSLSDTSSAASFSNGYPK